MKLFRKILFWIHLTAGVTAGVVILIMSATGAALALQPQILAWMDRDAQHVDVPQDAQRLPLAQLMVKVVASHADGTPGTVTVEADPSQAIAVSYGRDDIVYANPYTGVVLPTRSAGARRLFQQMTEWHRWLAVQGEGRTTARAATGASNLAFLFLGFSGLYLWMPNVWTLARVKAILTIDLLARGKARDFNWHNTIGFWCAIPIIIMTASGAVMSYPWANNLLYQLTGSPVPQQGGGGGAGRQGGAGGPAAGRQGAGREGGGREAGAREARGEESGRGGERAGGAREGMSARAERQEPIDYSSLDRAMVRIAETMPTWRNAALRVPARGEGPVAITLTDKAHWNRMARSQLTVQSASGDVVRWEPYSAQNAGQKARGWARFGHTGELVGLPGQLIAGLGSAGGVFLVWTGISLALRRLANWRRSASRVVRRAA